NLVEGGKCVLRTSQRQQRIATLIERISIAGLQRQGFVETFERLLVSLERVQHNAEIDPCIRSARVDFKRGADEPVGFSRLSALRFDRAGEMERVELIGRRLQHARENLPALAQPPLLLQRPRLAERPCDIRQAMRRGHLPSSLSIMAGLAREKPAGDHRIARDAAQYSNPFPGARTVNNNSASPYPWPVQLPARGNSGWGCKIRDCRQSPRRRTVREFACCNCKQMPCPYYCLRTTDLRSLLSDERRRRLPLRLPLR